MGQTTRHRRPPPALRTARTCYDHLAGEFGVAVLAALIERGALESAGGAAGAAALTPSADRDPLVLGPTAHPVFDRLGVDLDGLLARPASARPLLRCCVDWTEHRYHLAGALGAAVLAAAVRAGWVARRAGSRAVDVTDAGRRALLGDAGHRTGPTAYDRL